MIPEFRTKSSLRSDFLKYIILQIIYYKKFENAQLSTGIRIGYSHKITEENLVIFAKYAGYDPEVEYFPAGEPDDRGCKGL